jgi:O-acetyl-ADP-ribose deacetylase (regulator of RNase III)
MPIIYVKGDVTAAKEDVIAHGVNCKSVMGSGVALALLKKWPRVRKDYLKQKWVLGYVQYVPVEEDKYVANCATQFEYWPRDKVHADYGAIEQCMKNLHGTCTWNKYSLAMPKIGAGLAGGDWNRIEKIINDVFHDMEVKVYVI